MKKRLGWIFSTLTIFFGLAAVSVVLAYGISASGSWYALCSDSHGVVTGWVGPDRSRIEDARKDVEEHNKRFGHSATVVSN